MLMMQSFDLLGVVALTFIAWLRVDHLFSLQLDQGSLPGFQIGPEKQFIEPDRPQKLHYVQFLVIAFYAVFEGLGFFVLKWVRVFAALAQAGATLDEEWQNKVQ